MSSFIGRKSFILGLLVLATLLIGSCDPPVNPPPSSGCPSGNSTRTNGDDEFKRWINTVFQNSNSFDCDGWHELADGDSISTDNSGEAELNFSNCYPGRLYCFKNSAGTIRVRDCRKANYGVSGYCIPNGTWYTSSCRDEFQIYTGSASVKKTGSAFSITYLPEQDDVTLVVVLEGRIDIEPVNEFDPNTTLAEPITVQAGYFLFTMPWDQLSAVAGYPPREEIPLPELPAVAEELGIVDWMIDVRDKADREGILPHSWPEEFGGEGGNVDRPTEAEQILVSVGGGPLSEPPMQEAILAGVDWARIFDSDIPLIGFIQDEPIDLVNDWHYDPDFSRAMLEEMGYSDGFGTGILYQVEDEAIAQSAQRAAKYLAELGIDAYVEGLPSTEYFEVLEKNMTAGEPIIGIHRWFGD